MTKRENLSNFELFVIRFHVLLGLVKWEWPFSFGLISVCFHSAKVQIFRTLSVRVHTFSLLTLSLTWLSCYDFCLVLVMILRTWLYDWCVSLVFVILLLFVWTLMIRTITFCDLNLWTFVRPWIFFGIL